LVQTPTRKSGGRGRASGLRTEPPRLCAGACTRLPAPLRPCRYAARPPLAQERLSELPDGRLRLELKRPWQDGTTAVVLSSRRPDRALVCRGAATEVRFDPFRKRPGFPLDAASARGPPRARRSSRIHKRSSLVCVLLRDLPAAAGGRARSAQRAAVSSLGRTRRRAAPSFVPRSP
jgi:hypothetical protein